MRPRNPREEFDNRQDNRRDNSVEDVEGEDGRRSAYGQRKFPAPK